MKLACNNIFLWFFLYFYKTYLFLKSIIKFLQFITEKGYQFYIQFPLLFCSLQFVSQKLIKAILHFEFSRRLPFLFFVVKCPMHIHICTNVHYTSRRLNYHCGKRTNKCSEPVCIHISICIRPNPVNCIRRYLKFRQSNLSSVKLFINILKG